MKQFFFEKLQIFVFESSSEMAQLAADHVAETMRALLIQKEEISIYFSGAESQQEFHRCRLPSQV